MRGVLATLGIAAVLLAAGCSTSSPASPSRSAALSGTWGGSTSDSTGSMMGAGLSTSMMANTTWTITQNGSSFSGNMQFAGFHGGSVTVSGTLTGHGGTFTMTMPIGSMMMGACGATASGSFDMDEFMTQLHGTYTGTNTCSGPFKDGQVSFTRR